MRDERGESAQAEAFAAAHRGALVVYFIGDFSDALRRGLGTLAPVLAGGELLQASALLLPQEEVREGELLVGSPSLVHVLLREISPCGIVYLFDRRMWRVHAGRMEDFARSVTENEERLPGVPVIFAIWDSEPRERVPAGGLWPFPCESERGMDAGGWERACAGEGHLAAEPPGAPDPAPIRRFLQEQDISFLISRRARPLLSGIRQVLAAGGKWRNGE